MDLDVLDGMKDIQYPLTEDELKQAVSEWPISVEYTKLVEWLTKELQHFCKLDEHVNAITTSDDSKSFLLELSSFLKELGCSYKRLIEGSVEDRLKTTEDRYMLLDFLITELFAARILSVKKPVKSNIELTLNESETAASMKNMLIALNIPKPPSNVTCQMLFSKVQNKVNDLSSKCISDPLFSGLLSSKQWETLAHVQQDLQGEYLVRRQMLLKRLDVTIQSFQWSEKMKGKENEIARLYSDKRNALLEKPSIKISDLVAARAHLAVLEKTSSANVRKNTQSSINKVIIGRVPDRGGRPKEQQPPPPEMPSWAPRSQSQGGGRGSGGHYGGNAGYYGGGGSCGGDGYGGGSRGAGNRVQGGWNQNQTQRGGRGKGRDRF